MSWTSLFTVDRAAPERVLARWYRKIRREVILSKSRLPKYPKMWAKNLRSCGRRRRYRDRALWNRGIFRRILRASCEPTFYYPPTGHRTGPGNPRRRDSAGAATPICDRMYRDPLYMLRGLRLAQSALAPAQATGVARDDPPSPGLASVVGVGKQRQLRAQVVASRFSGEALKRNRATGGPRNPRRCSPMSIYLHASMSLPPLRPYEITRTVTCSTLGCGTTWQTVSRHKRLYCKQCAAKRAAARTRKRNAQRRSSGR